MRRNFVPVALNLYEVRKDKGEGGDFFRGMQKQTPEQYQGLYVVSPEGKVLASHSKMVEPAKKWADEVVAMIAAALEKSGPVAAREETRSDAPVDRGVGVRKDGTVVLAAYARPMVLGLDPRGFGERAFDSVVLTASEVRELQRAADAAAGSSWTLPSEMVKKLHKVLSSASDANTMPRADEVTEASLRCKVERVAGGVAYVSLTGRIAGVHVWEFDPHKGKRIRAEATLIGAAAVDRDSGKLLSLTVVADGRYRSFPPYDEPQKYGAVVEWRRE